MRLLLTLALLWPASVCRPVRVVFIQPTGETFTVEERTHASAAVNAALAWWEDLSPIPTRLTVVSTEVLTTTDDAYHSWGWVRPYLVDQNPMVTVFVLDNSASGALIFDDSAGEAQEWYGLVFAVLDPRMGPDGLAATLTHELGHVLYGLPHPRQCDLDIMCSTVTAYRLRFVGCASLEALGKPCRHIYLSMTYN